jgi:membrane protein DedA with SNARE-associated domain/membrane-associated phospholipid phosphatase
VTEFLTGLTEPWAYVVVALLAAAESGAFLGLVLPGEAAMLLGGVLVFQGHADLLVMLMCGVGGAVAGDSASYWIGRRLGPRLMRRGPGKRIGEQRWEWATSLVRRRGGRAVLIGRFVGVLRALVPAIAGSSGVPYRVFLPYSVAGATVWVVGFVVLGSAAGGSWRVIDRWAGRAGLILLGLLVVGIGVWVGARWIAGHRDAVLVRWKKLLGSPRVASIRRSRRREIDFLRRRFDRTSRFGLYLTVGLVLMMGCAWLFGELVDALEERENIYVIDAPVVSFLADHRSENMTTAMTAVTHIGGGLIVTAVLTTAAIGSVARSRRDPRWGAFFTATLVGAIGIDNVVKAIVDRPRPDIGSVIDVTGSSFPSGHASAAAALCAALAYALSRGTSWQRAVAIWAVAVSVASLVGFSRVYLGVHWPTDVLGGLLLGSGWVVVVATGTELLDGGRRNAGGS